MYNEILLRLVGRAGGFCLAFLIVCAVGAVHAQDQKPTVNDIEIRSGARGMILTVSGSGPMRVDVPGGAAAKYPELRVKINNARSALGANRNFSAPDALPITDVILSETPEGVSIVIKMRGLVSGPVDVRGSAGQVRILMTKDAQPELIWSLTRGTVSAATATAVPAQEAATVPDGSVDMKKLEERAARDTQSSAGGSMFTVSGQPQLSRPQPPPAPAASAQPATPAQPAASVASPPKPQSAVAPQFVPQRAETPRAQDIIDVEIPSDAEVSKVTRRASEGQLVRYKVLGRDPFVPLMRDTAMSELPRVENLRLVGVLEDSRERIALVEDFKNSNRAFALRTNDPVESGRVLRVQRDKVVFIIRDFDVSRSYTLIMTNAGRQD